MAIQIGAKPDSGFDDPIGMLKDCHRRIESFLGILCVVVGRAEGRSLTDEERDAVKTALEYFRTGGHRHTADEEESLFPRLRKSDAKFFKEIDQLEDDHHDANDLHGSIERLYSTWIESGCLGIEETQLLLSQIARLKQLYSTIFKSRKRSFLLARARFWTATLSQRSGPSFVSDGSNAMLSILCCKVVRPADFSSRSAVSGLPPSVLLALYMSG
jgi:hypothetical protein